MLRRSFLKVAVAATAALAATNLPARPDFVEPGILTGDAGTGPVRIGHAWMIMEDDVTGETRQAEWSKTPVWCDDPNWREALQAGAQVQVNSIDFGRVREAGMCTAIRLELDGSMVWNMNLHREQVIRPTDRPPTVIGVKI